MAKKETPQELCRYYEPPAMTLEAREAQLVSLAMDLAEKRIREGTASSQEVTHFLKIGSSEALIKKRILEEEEKLTRAKTEALQSQKHIEELYAKALTAMKDYGGQPDGDEEDVY